MIYLIVFQTVMMLVLLGCLFVYLNCIQKKTEFLRIDLDKLIADVDASNVTRSFKQELDISNRIIEKLHLIEENLQLYVSKEDLKKHSLEFDKKIMKLGSNIDSELKKINGKSKPKQKKTNEKRS